ncbi:hypothetical protein NDU88_007610 [Pleurodeles waltl]|uniref:Uncharacterized protein n=1 Tax=Pleurodeles waltl TaxID=8319 RepID=A0AAV7NWR7_PLEWA|nr:hypothetical protein NDU88_007610 [Pleurodeles waltl]
MWSEARFLSPADRRAPCIKKSLSQVLARPTTTPGPGSRGAARWAGPQAAGNRGKVRAAKTAEESKTVAAGQQQTTAVRQQRLPTKEGCRPQVQEGQPWTPRSTCLETRATKPNEANENLELIAI